VERLKILVYRKQLANFFEETLLLMRLRLDLLDLKPAGHVPAVLSPEIKSLVDYLLTNVLSRNRLTKPYGLSQELPGPIIGKVYTAQIQPSPKKREGSHFGSPLFAETKFV
jgi:hypothetical protein